MGNYLPTKELELTEREQRLLEKMSESPEGERNSRDSEIYEPGDKEITEAIENSGHRKVAFVSEWDPRKPDDGQTVAVTELEGRIEGIHLSDKKGDQPELTRKVNAEGQVFDSSQGDEWVDDPQRAEEVRHEAFTRWENATRNLDIMKVEPKPVKSY